MTPDEFCKLMQVSTDEQLLGPCLRDEMVPFVFSSGLDEWVRFRDFLAGKLAIDPTAISVVGSGRFGFSLKPGNNFRLFRDESDIDLVVVNSEMFDRLWEGLLRAAYPRPPINVSGWLRECQKQVYTGWLIPSEIRPDKKIYGRVVDPVLEINQLWFSVLKLLSKYVLRSHEKVNARLYRTWQHAEMYHSHSIRALRSAITEKR